MLQCCPVSTWSHGGFPCVCFLLLVCASCYLCVLPVTCVCFLLLCVLPVTCVCFLSLLCFLLHTSVCFLLLCVLFAACVLGADEPLFQPEMLTAVVSPLELCPKLVLCVVAGVVYCFNWPLWCGCVQIVGLLKSGEWCIAYDIKYFSCAGLVNLGLTLQRPAQLECLLCFSATLHDQGVPRFGRWST